jgi:hypothetical protein
MEFSNSKLCFILLLSTAILSTSIAHAATGTWIDSIDAPDTASPGEVVQVDMVVGYSFPEETAISPGVWDWWFEDWADDVYENVTGDGEAEYFLFLRVPDIAGEYLYSCVVMYWDGMDWAITGEVSALNFTINVQGIPVESFSAEIEEVEYPRTVETGADIAISVTVSYNLPDDTDIVVGITEIYEDVEETIDETFDTVSGAGTETYVFELVAPEEAGTSELSADILFLLDGEWRVTPDTWYEIFLIEAEEPEVIPPDDPVEPSGGIPGFPLAAIAVSVGASSLYLRKKV